MLDASVTRIKSHVAQLAQQPAGTAKRPSLQPGLQTGSDRASGQAVPAAGSKAQLPASSKAGSSPAEGADSQALRQQLEDVRSEVWSAVSLLIRCMPVLGSGELPAALPPLGAQLWQALLTLVAGCAAGYLEGVARQPAD